MLLEAALTALGGVALGDLLLVAFPLFFGRTREGDLDTRGVATLAFFGFGLLA